jgi:FkbM family methyltransferase
MMIRQKLKFRLSKLKQAIEVALFPKKNYLYSSKNYAYHTLSFAQEGEDILLERIFQNQAHGFYIDVGAHHPQRFSNTYKFYLMGWRGINIDAMPESMKSFEEIRPEDINIEAAISNGSEQMTYYMFNEPALNGFSKQLANTRDGLRDYKIIDRKLIKTLKLSEILEKYLSNNQIINFLSIDVEGLDYQVLLSNDWSKYRPEIILVEELSTSLENLTHESKSFKFLKEKGYIFFAKTFNTSFYKLTSE